MDAVILLNKPRGMTSFDAVRKCRRIFQEKKAGHTGTLDPEATGLMIILLGKYTKLLPYCVSGRKTYHAEFTFGSRTDTEDIWGTVTDYKEPAFHTDEELAQACIAMTGKIMQVPPMYSAIKKDGKKLYEYARKGIEVERQARPVEVHSLSVEKISDQLFAMDACVSSGTYIRTLITDYASKLGEYAAMSALTRTGIEHLHIEEAADFNDLENGKGLIDPCKVIDCTYQQIPLFNDKKVASGMKLHLDGYDDKIVFVHEKAPYAVYEKKEDGFYHCQRGLW